jgi:hypothetical protein
MSTEPKDGGPAQVQIVDGIARPVPWGGEISLRDYFAAKAMQGLLANPKTRSSSDALEAVPVAYKVAAAMLAQRERKT